MKLTEESLNLVIDILNDLICEGKMLELIYVAPWTVMLPGAAIMISVLLVNLLGDGVRRAIIAGVE